MLLLLACSEPPVRLDVPHVVQRPDFCGEACVEMALRHRGLEVDQDAVFDLAGVDPSLGRGARAGELRDALVRLGFDPGEGAVPAASFDSALRALIEDLRVGLPSILCLRAGDAADSPEHMVLATGWDGDVIVNDPAGSAGARLTVAQLRRRWPIAGGEGDLLIRLRLAPRALAPPDVAQGFTPADFAQEVRVVRNLVPEGFALRVEAPFLVIAEDEATAASYAERTVRPAVAALRRDLFDRDPEHIFAIWLFAGDASYRSHAWSIFGDRPDTPYGYASLEDRALVMNIATGGGTLLHEMVHPYVHAELQAAPPWLNEGLASLYEQASMDDGRIVGLPNWRLAGLQGAIANGWLGDFRTLMALDAEGFYAGDDGTHYAQARYLCLWLQEHGRLEGFYRAFKVAGDDPTGIVTLERTVGDLDAFAGRWEAWVMDLRFP